MAETTEHALVKRLGLTPLKGRLHVYFMTVKSLKDKDDCTLLIELRRSTRHNFFYATIQFNGGKPHQGYGDFEGIQRDINTLLVLYEAERLRAGHHD